MKLAITIITIGLPLIVKAIIKQLRPMDTGATYRKFANSIKAEMPCPFSVAKENGFSCTLRKNIINFKLPKSFMLNKLDDIVLPRQCTIGDASKCDMPKFAVTKLTTL